MAIKNFPGGKGGGGFMHPKVGGMKGISSGNRMSRSRGGSLAGLPPKASNPYKSARMVTNRAVGTAKMPGKGIY